MKDILIYIIFYSFGVCCVFLYDSTSDTTINYNDTYIQNPNYPSVYGDSNALTYTVKKCSDGKAVLFLDLVDNDNYDL